MWSGKNRGPNHLLAKPLYVNTCLVAAHHHLLYCSKLIPFFSTRFNFLVESGGGGGVFRLYISNRFESSSAVSVQEYVVRLMLKMNQVDSKYAV